MLNKTPGNVLLIHVHGSVTECDINMARGTYIDLPDPDRSQTRPTSSSTFADSAVDMAASTPVEKPQISRAPTSDYFNGMIPFTPLDIDQTLSNKMRQLAAVAWAMEQDEDMTEAKRERLHSMLSGLELFLEASSPTKFQEVVKLEQAQTAQDDPEQADAVIDDSEDVEVDEDSDEWVDESELIAVRESLAATVASMRHRQEEQRHLHELTVQKLEAVAQRCLLQEQQAEDLLRDMRQIRKDNDHLQTENDNLRDRISNLQADASRNEFAVEAMSSAVTGLEGWIETATHNLLHHFQNINPRGRKLSFVARADFEVGTMLMKMVMKLLLTV